jgi:nicotinate-nucleotide--dimethylbenzimidazole phosphoribosyltransferase
MRMDSIVERIQPVDRAWIERAQAHIDSLTKPVASLGLLETLAARLCAIQETLMPRPEPRRVVIFAADHGVATENVSAYPAAVTAQMVANFVRGGAAINALAYAAGADVWVYDVGVAERCSPAEGCTTFVSRRAGAGTRNIASGPAMTKPQLDLAIAAGIEAGTRAADAGVKVLACGDMGIANTTAASAVTAALTGVSARCVTGRGTGVDDARLERKIEVVQAALRANADAREPLDVLRCLGGFEIAAIVGAYLAAASRRLAIVGDGFIATAAALIAVQLCPAVRDYWFAGHRSPEPGHAVQLAWLNATPILDLQMRLGEATGAALAMPLLTAAAAMSTRMATFAGAGVSRQV